jgi:hypothetical protein
MSGNAELGISAGQIFTKETLVKGQPARVRCVDIGGQTFAISGGALQVVALEDEWYEDVDDPEAVIKVLRTRRDLGADLFTFWQRLPDAEPRHTFYREWEEIAALKITSYEHWWGDQIKSRIRTTIRKSEKEGLSVREASYDDDFVRGMTAIFNESAVRQGRKFWHYGKDSMTVKAQFSRCIHRERMIGAYVGDEMVGFVMLGDAGRFALLGQIISSLNHRDRAPNNALVAKSVEISANLGFEYLVYWYWGDDSLAEFKRRCGFEKVRLPRYYVPLTLRGRLALRTGVHRGLAAMLPAGMKRTLKRWRASWYS